MAKTRALSTGFFLQLSTACFFLVLGICGIFPNVQESIFSLNDNNLVVEAIFGVLELICALVLFIGLFTRLEKKWMSLASMIIFIFWIVTIAYIQFFAKFAYNTGWISLAGLMEWLLNLMLECVVLASIWTINRHYSE